MASTILAIYRALDFEVTDILLGQLRRLTKELEDYVPNLVSGHAVPVVSSPGTSWWTPQRLKEEGTLSPDSRALLVRQDMARELAELNFPKGNVISCIFVTTL